jgi:RNA recognition motif-containing protein
MKSVYIGNLPFKTTESELSQVFSEYGQVQDVKLINDRATGRPRGFGFVLMDDEGALKAIQALDGTQMGGRTLKLNEARERETRPMSIAA